MFQAHRHSEELFVNWVWSHILMFSPQTVLIKQRKADPVLRSVWIHSMTKCFHRWFSFMPTTKPGFIGSDWTSHSPQPDSQHPYWCLCISSVKARRHHSWTNTCFLCVRLRSLKETKNCHKNTFLFSQINKEHLETLPPGWHLHRWPAGCKTQNTPQLCRASQTSGAELPNQSNGLPVAAVTEGRKETPLCFWCI